MNTDNKSMKFSKSSCEKGFTRLGGIISISHHTYNPFRRRKKTDGKDGLHDGKRMITIASENHVHFNDKCIPCSENGTMLPVSGKAPTIGSYACSVINKIPSTNIYLECEDAREYKLLASHSIYDVCSRVDQKKIPSSKIVSFDKRIWFLGEQNHWKVYTSRLGLAEFTGVQIIEQFVKPYYQKKDAFVLDKSLYTQNVYNMLTHDYLNKIEKAFRNITDACKNRKLGNRYTEKSSDAISKQRSETHIRRIEVHRKLKVAWLYVCDYFVLADILKKNPRCKCFIVVCGYHHARNMRSTLSEIAERETILENIYEYHYNEKDPKGGCVLALNPTSQKQILITS